MGFWDAFEHLANAVAIGDRARGEARGQRSNGQRRGTALRRGGPSQGFGSPPSALSQRQRDACNCDGTRPGKG